MTSLSLGEAIALRSALADFDTCQALRTFFEEQEYLADKQCSRFMRSSPPEHDKATQAAGKAQAYSEALGILRDYANQEYVRAVGESQAVA